MFRVGSLEHVLKSIFEYAAWQPKMPGLFMLAKTVDYEIASEWLDDVDRSFFDEVDEDSMFIFVRTKLSRFALSAFIRCLRFN